MKNSILDFVKGKIGSFLRELFIIVIGVTLAFYISSKHEKEQHNILINNILNAIKNEQTTNIARIDATIISNQQMLQAYDSIISNIKPSKNEITITVSKAVFNDMAFELAIQSGALSSLDFNLFADINWCYKLQKSCIEIQESYISYLEVNTIKKMQHYISLKNKLKDINRAFELLKEESQSLVNSINDYL